MSSLVSICIPTYNQTTFLQRTLDSIVEQDYPAMEVIVTDDSTTEAVSQLVAKYTTKLTLKYHKNAIRLGSPANWNKALSLASGDLIKFVHHDDWLAFPQAITTFVNAFEQHKNAGFVFCVSEVLDVTTGSSRFNKVSSGFLNKVMKDPRRLFSDNRIGSPTAVMFKRNNEKFDEQVKYVVDIDFYIRLLLPNPRLIYIDQPLIVNTANHPGQVTAASLGKETQIKEYCYLYNKVYGNKIPPIELAAFFISLFRKFSIQRATDIRQLSVPIPRPTWFFKLLILLSK